MWKVEYKLLLFKTNYFQMETMIVHAILSWNYNTLLALATYAHLPYVTGVYKFIIHFLLFEMSYYYSFQYFVCTIHKNNSWLISGKSWKKHWLIYLTKLSSNLTFEQEAEMWIISSLVFFFLLFRKIKWRMINGIWGNTFIFKI